MTFVVIGASRGIGYEFLKQLSAIPSVTAIGTARTPAKLEEQLKSDGITNVDVYAADLDQHASLSAAASKISEKHKSIDCLIINGAYLPSETAMFGPTGFAGKESIFEEDINQSMLTNAIGPLNTINAFLPLIKSGKAKKIFVISTGAADLDFIDVTSSAGAVAYAVSKAAVNVVVTKTAVELKPEGIIVLSISPGFVKTGQDPAFLEAVKQAFKAYEPKFRGAITPEQSVRAMLKVFHDVTIKDTGAFISHLGNKQWLSADGVGDEVV